ncbi:MAG: PorT family protein [Bacteroidia bacterium]|nr:PorT family protein [Bacteroidia bacterium]
MKKHIYILLVVFCTLFVTTLNAQHRRVTITNGIGLQGGVTQFDIISDNLITKKGNGWLGGMAATVDLPNKWYNISYNIQLSENNLEVEATAPLGSTEEYLEYSILMAQIALMGHVKIIGPYLTIDVGPMIQYSGELQLQDEAKGNYALSGDNSLTADELSDISKFNVNSVVGLSAGFGNIKLRFQYIYGLTNILNNVNSSSNLTGQDKIKGNQSLLAFTAMLTF